MSKRDLGSCFSNEKKTRFDVRPGVGETIRTLRKAAGVSQVELGEVLNLHQTAICRIERSNQILSAEELNLLSKFFDIRVDHFLAGEINIWRVAEKFGRRPPIPNRYQELPYSKLRESAPLLLFISKKFGINTYRELLQKLCMGNPLFLDLNTTIGTNFSLDILRFIVETNLLKSSHFEELLEFTRDTHVHGDLGQTYRSVGNPIELVQMLVLSQNRYESNFLYKIESLGKRSLEIAVQPAPHMENVSYRDEILGDILCRYKKGYFSKFPLFISKSPLALKERECHFQGAHRCLYELSAA